MSIVLFFINSHPDSILNFVSSYFLSPNYLSFSLYSLCFLISFDCSLFIVDCNCSLLEQDSSRHYFISSVSFLYLQRWCFILSNAVFTIDSFKQSLITFVFNIETSFSLKCDKIALLILLLKLWFPLIILFLKNDKMALLIYCIDFDFVWVMLVNMINWFVISLLRCSDFNFLSLWYFKTASFIWYLTSFVILVSKDAICFFCSWIWAINLITRECVVSVCGKVLQDDIQIFVLIWDATFFSYCL